MKYSSRNGLVWKIVMMGCLACQNSKIPVTVLAQDQFNVWSVISEKEQLRRLDTANLPEKYTLLTLKKVKADTRLNKLDENKNDDIVRFELSANKTLLFDFPLDDGSFKTFILTNSNMMSPELAKKFPDIKSFKGQAKDQPEIQVRVDVNPKGLFAMITFTDKKIFIKPIDEEQTFYLAYDEKYARIGDRKFDEPPIRRSSDQ